MARLRRKRRTREHVIADLSVHHVEGHVLRCGWVVERVAHDYGIDLELHTFDRSGQVQEGEVLLQIKATDRLRRRSGETPVSFRVDRRDVVRWRAELFPVILILFDARKDVAYWLYVQSYFRAWWGSTCSQRARLSRFTFRLQTFCRRRPCVSSIGSGIE